MKTLLHIGHGIAPLAVAAGASAQVTAGTVDASFNPSTGEVFAEVGSNVAVFGFEDLTGDAGLLPSNLSSGGLAATQATATVIAFSDIGGLPEGSFTLGSIFPIGSAASDIGFGFSEVGGPFIQSTLTVIPEPTTAAVLGLGGLALLRRRRAA